MIAAKCIWHPGKVCEGHPSGTWGVAYSPRLAHVECCLWSVSGTWVMDVLSSEQQAEQHVYVLQAITAGQNAEMKAVLQDLLSHAQQQRLAQLQRQQQSSPG